MYSVKALEDDKWIEKIKTDSLVKSLKVVHDLMIKKIKAKLYVGDSMLFANYDDRFGG